MEEGAKRRLAGAAVMVALLVIFLPMLLEKETPSPLSEREMSLPPQPDFDTGFDASVTDRPHEPSASAVPENGERIPEDSPLPQELPPPELFDVPPTAEPELATDAAAGEEPVPDDLPEQETLPVVKPAPPPKTSTTSRSVTTAKPSPPPHPATAPRSESASKSPPAQASTPAQTTKPSSWVLQVASLRERNRAYALVQELREKGFPAYLEEARVNQIQWHRVRIGPEGERKRIDSFAASLKAKTGLTGQIQRYP